MPNIPYPSFGETPPATLEEARVVILPLPYEGTVSYGTGTSQGPRAILEASKQLEVWDELHGREILPELPTHTLQPPSLENLNPEQVVQRIYATTLPHLQAGRMVVGLGGEHSVTEGVIKAYQTIHGNDFTVVQIDAHADLRNSYHDTPHSHACIMRRVWDMGLNAVQLGIRSISREEIRHVRYNGLNERIFWARDIVRWHRQNNTQWLDRMGALLKPKVFLTIDLDGFDPSVVPGTGTPEPGGLDWYMVGEIIDRITAQCEIIGFDITELAPIPNQQASEFLAARLVQRILGYIKP
ncbi:putative agmatinase [Magnetococcus marinus MC-1]|uniref:Putative agmatinase n=1 Tax=Magnetococcus marinus (strain ATCC BAA-1437 / JCM 17883 / MC-1) TaxID=156889 RepID=A0LDK6_MAGMM|nr:agmatinase [Magnetococcus marinus]ABK46049.1 putative agmatinase [Magnetococcus marinus MC-1]